MPSYSPVFSAQFVVHTGGDPYSPFEVPDGFTAVIREAAGFSGAGGFVAQVRIQNSLIAPGVKPISLGATGIPAWAQWQGRIVVPEGGQISVDVASFIDDPDFYVGGYLLRNTVS